MSVSIAPAGVVQEADWMAALRSARTDLVDVLNRCDRWQADRMVERTQHTHRTIQRSLDTRSHTLSTVGILNEPLFEINGAIPGLIADCQQLRHQDNTNVYDRLVPYLEALDHLLVAAAERLGIKGEDVEAYDSERAQHRFLSKKKNK